VSRSLATQGHKALVPYGHRADHQTPGTYVDPHAGTIRDQYSVAPGIEGAIRGAFDEQREQLLFGGHCKERYSAQNGSMAGYYGSGLTVKGRR
jgi:hypothetical protein